MVLTMRMMMECEQAGEAEKIAHEALQGAADKMERYTLSDTKPYWKIDGWYVTVIRATCKAERSPDGAREVAERITDKVAWDADGFDGTADARPEVMGSTFAHPAVRFCWFYFAQ
ncbi:MULTISPECIES: hypothetical protein [Saccharibacillus]|uniref:Uncharacterized protein n=1 Tax=Saccharibacillus brassicae TaxID=2583377 RepID=A0A4Y6UYX8_SACBS|nr:MULTISPECIES: hypothetical protein [Saccharibacillus]MWJ31895.1 hypothetical protein [Saccharibacillus sp. WB 17]QDH21626.1 hypothetical protein FFV09_12690 [Saccharibacillus brassicae]